jgi:hypothetical protein
MKPSKLDSQQGRFFKFRLSGALNQNHPLIKAILS